MATTVRQPMLAFLRPLAPPRPATIRHFLRLSQSVKPQAEAAAVSDRNLVASRTAPATYPPPSLKSLPRPKKSHASHRTSQPTKLPNYPDRRRAAPESILPLSEAESAPNLPYFVTRSKSNQLPIYQEAKRGGNLQQTRVKKISGDAHVLRKALESHLSRREKSCVVNPVTGHVVIRGHHKESIEQYLKARRF